MLFDGGSETNEEGVGGGALKSRFSVMSVFLSVHPVSEKPVGGPSSDLVGWR